MDNTTLIVIFSGATFGLLVYGAYLWLSRRRTLLAERLETYAGIEEEAALAASEQMQERSPVARLIDLLLGRSYVQRLEEDLARADVPLRSVEYLLARAVLLGVGLVVGL